jgi:hypothetical protein
VPAQNAKLCRSAASAVRSAAEPSLPARPVFPALISPHLTASPVLPLALLAQVSQAVSPASLPTSSSGPCVPVPLLSTSSPTVTESVLPAPPSSTAALSVKLVAGALRVPHAQMGISCWPDSASPAAPVASPALSLLQPVLPAHQAKLSLQAPVPARLPTVSPATPSRRIAPPASTLSTATLASVGLASRTITSMEPTAPPAPQTANRVALEESASLVPAPSKSSAAPAFVIQFRECGNQQESVLPAPLSILTVLLVLRTQVPLST